MPRLVVVTLALVAVVAVVFLATRPLGGGEAQSSFVAFARAVPGVQVGQLAPGGAQAGAPDLALVGLDGEPVDLADFVGRPLWVIFWKTACEPCEEEAPAVAAAVAAREADELAVIGIDVWDSAAVVQDYADRRGLEIPIAVATTSAAGDAYGVWGAPTHYFIDREGVIRDRYFGPMTRDLIDESLRRII